MAKQPDSGKPDTDVKLPDPAVWARNWARITEQSQKMLAEFAAKQQSEPGPAPAGPLPAPVNPDPLNIGGAFMEIAAKLMADPAKLAEAQTRFWQDYATLWANTADRFLGREAPPLVQPDKGDKRFKDPAWQESAVFDYLKQSYLLTARWVQTTVQSAEGVDPKVARKAEFYTKQFVDALSPSNFALTNPEVVRATLDSNGENLVNGLKNLLEDIERGKGKLNVKMVDAKAFTVGETIATTPGKVIYQNDLMQLLQFEPTTKQVYRRPLFIVPPWINKYYILDLKPQNSFIRWMVARGYTVFVVSWNQPDETTVDKTFESYMREGILEGLDAVKKATGEDEVTAIGYCIGGTLMASTLAWMAQKKDERIKAVTFFAAQVDFADAGELSVFTDEDTLKYLENLMSEKGYLDGGEMATTFNMLRANDLIWSFVVNNYLLGKEPFPFDLLYWNSDCTRMPAKMHGFYLRNMYQKNLLSQPGQLELAGEKLDLRKIKIPVYLQASKDDHIAPYKSVYKATQLYGGPVRFLMAGSGHIAGVINHPDARKYQHWRNDTATNPANVEDWIKGAREYPGSWWDDWDAWLSEKSGDKVPARKPGDGKLKVIEPAPGSYVKKRIVD
ncbi:MAG: class I poly(R)-hydroxyalkanoic acid synthase [Ferrovibrio sp.]|uniref:PHA/PHB synthase family protein n=1 Tax=Ferrovibrio sp. TaxID=1917215 RepID=UPI00262CA384|nr:class I poly(R)-hydroxyalkanoic acid synthase [Ferrovibrio sp.]MCW0233368.1 class I poly(R)-hydroxyalkanoic acid synthase [Ferrovibrio sp.]